MNGKKSRLLRSLAGPKQETGYHGVQHTIRNKEIKVPVTQADGSMIEKVVASVQTATWRMSQGPRLLNKILKRKYLKEIRFA